MPWRLRTRVSVFSSQGRSGASERNSIGNLGGHPRAAPQAPVQFRSPQEHINHPGPFEVRGRRGAAGNVRRAAHALLQTPRGDFRVVLVE